MGLTGELEKLRGENDTRHRENRDDIQALREDMRAIELELGEIKGKIKPLLDNGQPGIITRMSEKLDDMLEQLVEVRIAQGADVGRRGEHDWWRGSLAALIVGLAAVLATHFWK